MQTEPSPTRRYPALEALAEQGVAEEKVLALRTLADLARGHSCAGVTADRVEPGACRCGQGTDSVQLAELRGIYKANKRAFVDAVERNLADEARFCADKMKRTCERAESLGFTREDLFFGAPFTAVTK